jgi:outer membrane protein assembly factor BamB
MTTRVEQAPSGPEGAPEGAVMMCPACGRSAPADAVVCRFCWRPIHEQALDSSSAAELLRYERDTVERTRRARKIRLFRAVLLLLVLPAYVIGVMVTGDPELLPLPRSVEATIASPLQSPGSWPTSGGDIGLTRATAASPHLDGDAVWSATVDSAITTPIVVGEGALYFGVTNAALVALSLDDGRELWRAPVPGQLDAAPTLADGRLYVPQRDGNIAVFDPVTGQSIWTESHDGPTFVSSPVVDRGVVYGAGLGDVRAFDAETGDLIWRHKLGGAGSSTAAPAVSANEVVVATSENALVFNRATGEQTFFYRLRAPAHVAVHENQVFVIGRSRLIVFGFEQRRPWWEPFRLIWGQMWILGMAPDVPDPPAHWGVPLEQGTHPIAIAGDVVVVAAPKGNVRGLDVTTGQELWSHDGAGVITAPVATGGGVLITHDDSITVLDPRTGTVRSQTPFAGQRLNGVTVTSGATYVVANGNTITALR